MPRIRTMEHRGVSPQGGGVVPTLTVTNWDPLAVLSRRPRPTPVDQGASNRAQKPRVDDADRCSARAACADMDSRC